MSDSDIKIQFGNFTLHIDLKERFAGNAYFNHPANPSETYNQLCEFIRKELKKDYRDHKGKGKRVWGPLNDSDIDKLKNLGNSYTKNVSVVKREPLTKPEVLAESDERSTMTRIEQAYQYIYDNTMSAALSCDALEDKTKNVIKDTDKWLKRFRRVGDLWIYINRFKSPSDAGPIYDDLKANGIHTFEDIREGFDKQFGRWKDDRTTYNDFVIGGEYTSFDILIFVQHYNTQAGGMFVVGDDGQHESVVIKATLSGGGYKNEWFDPKESLKYYFKSRKNIFKESYKENKAILDHPDAPIYTFVREKDEGPFTFEGVFYYGKHHIEDDGSKWFELKRDFRATDEPIVLKSFLDEELDNKVKQSSSTDSASRKARLSKASKKPKKVITQSTSYIRNPDVIADVLERAAGYCEVCQESAPFMRSKDGTPYLEVHHVKQLSDDGDDTVDNAKALCPNCHRKAHYG